MQEVARGLMLRGSAVQEVEEDLGGRFDLWQMPSLVAEHWMLEEEVVVVGVFSVAALNRNTNMPMAAEAQVAS